jgi:cytoskeletal protein CcmA (bactofilin family)
MHDQQDEQWSAPEIGTSEAPKAGVIAPAPVLRPSLGADTSVSGRLSFTVPTRIDGKLRGEVRASDLLVVGEQGFIEGVVRALKLVVLGEVRGEVRGAESIEVGRTGRLIGTVEAQTLTVEEGGCLDGDCRIAPPRDNVRALRPAAEA